MHLKQELPEETKNEECKENETHLIGESVTLEKVVNLVGARGPDSQQI